MGGRGLPGFHSLKSLANVRLPYLMSCCSDRMYQRVSLTEKQCFRKWINDLDKEKSGNVNNFEAKKHMWAPE